MTGALTGVRFGVFLPAWLVPGEPPPSVGFLQDFVRRAEDLGFDSVWVFDHLFEAPPSYRVVFMEPLTTLALIVGATRRVSLGTGILVLPLRDPVVTAKAVANLDAVSGGRVIFGVGVGWDEKEFQACQVPKETRGRRMDEMLEIINGLWTEHTFAYHGRYFRIPEVRLVPRPLQQPRPPILVAGGLVPSGTSKHITSSKGYTPQRSLQRAATLGDGLMTAYRSAPGLDMSQLTASWEVMRAEARAAGRDLRSLRFAHQDHLHIDREAKPQRLAQVLGRFSHNRYEDTAGMYLMGRPEDLVPRFQARIDAGVDEIAFSVLSGDPAQLDLFIKEIRPHLRPRHESHGRCDHP
jgi:probable F420-dependent oxidoreductase